MNFRKPFQKLISAGLVFVLSAQQVLPAFVEKNDIWSARRKNNTSVSQYVSLPSPARFSARSLSVPASIGTLRQDTLSPITHPQKTIIHIEDVHSNKDAQQNIAAALAFLTKTQKVDFIGLEGAWGQIDVSAFRAYPDQQALELAVEHLAAEKKLSGPMQMALTTSFSSRLIGIDDAALYAQNLQAFTAGEVISEKTKATIVKALAFVQERKRNTFSAALLAFDAQAASYATHKISLGVYAGSLAMHPEFSAEKYPEIYRFKNAIALEKDFNADRVALQKKEVAALLGRGESVDFAKYSDLSVALKYAELSNQLDAKALIKEVATLEAHIYQRLAVTTAEQSLLAESRELQFARKLVERSLSADEWKTYKATVKNPRFAKPYEKFYEAATARDEAMVANVLSASKKMKTDVAVIVTGGFHSAGMGAALTENGFRVITLTPRIETLDSENGTAYLSRFCQARTPLERFVYGSRLFVVLPQFPESIRAEVAQNAIAESALTNPKLGNSFFHLWYRRLTGSATATLRVVRASPKSIWLLFKSSKVRKSALVAYEKEQAPYLSGPRLLPVSALLYPLVTSRKVFPLLVEKLGVNRAEKVVRWIGFSSVLIEIPSLLYVVSNVNFFTTLVTVLLFVFLHFFFEFFSASLPASYPQRDWKKSMSIRGMVMALYILVGLVFFINPKASSWILWVPALNHLLVDINFLFDKGWEKDASRITKGFWSFALQILSPFFRLGMPVFNWFARAISVENHIRISYWLHKHILIHDKLRDHKLKLFEFMKDMIDPNNNARQRFAIILRAWDTMRLLAAGKEPLHQNPEGIVEIHPSEPCSNKCSFCRGDNEVDAPDPKLDLIKGLRQVTGSKMMSAAHMIEIVQGVHKMNARAAFKISGIIGEPLLNKHTLAVMQLLNEQKSPWGIVTNGKHFDDQKVVDAVLNGAEYVNISVDAGSDYTYSGFGSEQFQINQINREKMQKDASERSIDLALVAILRKSLANASAQAIADALTFMMRNHDVTDYLTNVSGDDYAFVGNERKINFSPKVTRLLRTASTISAEDKLALYREIIKAAYPTGIFGASGLKGGQAGDYELVLNNIQMLTTARDVRAHKTRVSVSFLMDKINYHEIPQFIRDVMPLQPDAIEFKMEHFDERRVMSPEQIEETYGAILAAQAEYKASSTKIRLIQNLESALDQVRGKRRIEFTRCAVAILGNLSFTPTGIAKPCCHYYLSTIGDLGDLSKPGASVHGIMRGEQREAVLRGNPKKMCTMCAPADFRINDIVHVMTMAFERSPGFLDWAERNYISRLQKTFYPDGKKRGIFSNPVFMSGVMSAWALLLSVIFVPKTMAQESPATPIVQTMSQQSIATAFDRPTLKGYASVSNAYADIKGEASWDIHNQNLAIVHVRSKAEFAEVSTSIKDNNLDGVLVVFGGGKENEQDLLDEADRLGIAENDFVGFVFESDLPIDPTTGRASYDDVLKGPHARRLSAIQSILVDGKILGGNLIVVSKTGNLFNVSDALSRICHIIMEVEGRWTRVPLDQLLKASLIAKTSA